MSTHYPGNVGGQGPPAYGGIPGNLSRSPHSVNQPPSQYGNAMHVGKGVMDGVESGLVPLQNGMQGGPQGDLVRFTGPVSSGPLLPQSANMMGSGPVPLHQPPFSSLHKPPIPQFQGMSLSGPPSQLVSQVPVSYQGSHLGSVQGIVGAGGQPGGTGYAGMVTNTQIPVRLPQGFQGYSPGIVGTHVESGAFQSNIGPPPVRMGLPQSSVSVSNHPPLSVGRETSGSLNHPSESSMIGLGTAYAPSAGSIPPSTSRPGQQFVPPLLNQSPAGVSDASGPMPPSGHGSGFPPPASQGILGSASQSLSGPQGHFPGSHQAGFGMQHTRTSTAPLQAQPQRRLDPEQMPSPIQVIEDDRRSRSGPFQTNQKGTLPPLVTTSFITQDQGFTNPRLLRSTMYNVPCTGDMLKASHIPLALSITPFAKLASQEAPPPIVDLGELGPVRCKRCKAYMNPYMQFTDGGRRFQCVFCSASTDVPNEYFAHLDHTGRRVDCYSRAELCLGTYEFIATKDYCKNNTLPKEPAFIFMIDVSYNSIKSGLVSLICQRLKDDILTHLPKEIGAEESEIRIGFVTYHKELHFYNVKSSLAQPQMMVVSDLEDMFVPLVDGFLVKLSESEAVIDSLLAQIPQLFAECKETETVLGPVIQAGLDALKSSERCGRLYVFHTSLPTMEAPGKLKNRDDRKLLGTDKEKTILTTQNPFYTKLGQDCVAAGCSVDLFLFPNSYCDVASMADVVRLTSSNLYKYSYFQADLDGERFIEDLQQNVKRPMAFDAILRIRTSTGIRPVDFFGNFYMSNTTDVEMAAVDSEQSIAVEIKHDDKLSEAEGAFVQVAILYTSVSGQRRLRVINQGFNCCTQMADLFRSCELDTLINFLAKQAIRHVLNHNPKYMREHIMNEVAQILACYRKNCANPSSVGQLILPECMKLLPLYANCIIKSDGIQGGSEISTDDRSYLMHLINAMDVTSTNVFFYPRLLPLHTADFETNEQPTAIRCSVERLQDCGIYLLENGLSMFLWIGHNVDRELIQQIFGVASAAQVDIDKVQLLDLDNPVSRKLREMVQKIRQERSRYLKLTIVRQRDKLEPWFNHFLVEDKGMNGSSSYVDFLCHIHKEIRNILN